MNERYPEPVRPLLLDEWFAEEVVTLYADLPYRHGIPQSGTGLALYEELGINQPVTNAARWIWGNGAIRDPEVIDESCAWGER